MVAAAHYSLSPKNHHHHHHLLPILFLFFSFPKSVSPIPTQELDTALSLLRRRGYNLISNAIATSDLRFDLLASPSLTLFAPTDSSLFALDMTLSAPAYVSILRSHAVPRRLSAADLRSRRPSSSIPTLLPSRSLRITFRHRIEGFIPYAIVIDGVNLTSPGLYYGRNVAVHGLSGVLSLRSQEDPVLDSHSSRSSNSARNKHANWTDRSHQGHENGNVSLPPVANSPANVNEPVASRPERGSPVIVGHPTGSVMAPSISPGSAPAFPPISPHRHLGDGVSVLGISRGMSSVPKLDKNIGRRKRRGNLPAMLPPLKDAEDGEGVIQSRALDEEEAGERVEDLDVVRFWNEDPHVLQHYTVKSNGGL